MTPEEFGKIVKAMRTYYPNQNTIPNEQAFLLWYEQLGDLELQDVTVALKRWVSENKWPPTIADLRQYTHATQYVAALEQKRVERLTGTAQAAIEIKTEEEQTNVY